MSVGCQSGRGGGAVCVGRSSAGWIEREAMCALHIWVCGCSSARANVGRTDGEYPNCALGVRTS